MFQWCLLRINSKKNCEAILLGFINNIEMYSINYYTFKY